MSSRRGRELGVDGFATASAGPIGILVWQSEFSVAGAQGIAATLEGLIRLYPGKKLGFLTVVEPSMDVLVPAEVREALARLLKSVDRSLAAAAIVYEGHGFQATIARSVVTAISVAARASFAYRVFAELNVALPWIVQKVARDDAALLTQLGATVVALRRGGSGT